MDTEFKFRAWDKRSNRFVDSGIQFNNTTMRLATISDLILMRYTGLKDKNGKEIYEGDLVRQKQKFADGYQIFLIAWGHIGWFPELKARKLEKMMHKIEGENDADWEQFEVIGNIYENPELLKGEDSE